MPPPRVLRRIYPDKSLCPECKGEKYLPCGRSRGGLLRYRECALCHHRFAVGPIGEVIDDGGSIARIRVVP